MFYVESPALYYRAGARHKRMIPPTAFLFVIGLADIVSAAIVAGIFTVINTIVNAIMAKRMDKIHEASRERTEALLEASRGGTEALLELAEKRDKPE